MSIINRRQSTGRHLPSFITRATPTDRVNNSIDFHTYAQPLGLFILIFSKKNQL